jgi:hypothetical protein
MHAKQWGRAWLCCPSTPGHLPHHLPTREARAAVLAIDNLTALPHRLSSLVGLPLSPLAIALHVAPNAHAKQWGRARLSAVRACRAHLAALPRRLLPTKSSKPFLLHSGGSGTLFYIVLCASGSADRPHATRPCPTSCESFLFLSYRFFFQSRQLLIHDSSAMATQHAPARQQRDGHATRHDTPQHQHYRAHANVPLLAAPLLTPCKSFIFIMSLFSIPPAVYSVRRRRVRPRGNATATQQLCTRQCVRCAMTI